MVNASPNCIPAHALFLRTSTLFGCFNVLGCLPDALRARTRSRSRICIPHQIKQVQPSFAYPAPACYYPYMYSWGAWPSQPAKAPASPAHVQPMLSRQIASQQLLDMGLPAFSSLAAGAPQTTMQSSLTDGPRRSSRGGAAPPAASSPPANDPYLARLMHPPKQWHPPQTAQTIPARPPTTMPSASKVLASQHALGPPRSSGPATSSVHNPPMSPRVLREALGGDVYTHFRDVLLKQQEALTHQVIGVVGVVVVGGDFDG